MNVLDRTATPTPHATRHARVLIAEDDEELARLLIDVLIRDGHEVDVVRSGPRLLDVLRDPDALRRYDLVLSDVRMPGMTGIDVIAVTDRDARPPFALMTAFPSASLTRAAIQFGADALLAKPFDIQQVLDLVHGVLETRHRH